MPTLCVGSAQRTEVTRRVRTLDKDWTGTGRTPDRRWTETGQRRAFKQGEREMNPLDALTPKAKARRFRALLPDIEAKIEAGVRHADILRALKAQGLELLENTYFTYLRRYRRKRSKTERREAQAAPPSTPPANDPPGEQAGRRPPTFEYDPRGIPELLK